MSEHDKVRAALALANDSLIGAHEHHVAIANAAAHIEAQAAEIAALRQQLGECFRLAGGDTDGNPGPHHAHRAVEVVRDLADCYEERGMDLVRAEAEAARLRPDARRYGFLRFNRKADTRTGEELDAAIDDAMRGGAE